MCTCDALLSHKNKSLKLQNKLFTIRIIFVYNLSVLPPPVCACIYHTAVRFFDDLRSYLANYTQGKLFVNAPWRGKHNYKQDVATRL